MLACILVVVLTVLNLILYHKVFNVFYFDLGRGLTRELVTSFFIAIIEASLIMHFGKIALVIIGIILLLIGVLFAIKEIIATVKEGKEWYVNIKEKIEKRKADKAAGETVSNKPTTQEPIVAINNQQKDSDSISYIEPVTMLEGTSREVIKEKEEIKSETKSEFMFCPHCGEKISRTAKFCNYCGKSNTYNK